MFKFVRTIKKHLNESEGQRFLAISTTLTLSRVTLHGCSLLDNARAYCPE